jgi:hypothetical protein
VLVTWYFGRSVNRCSLTFASATATAIVCKPRGKVWRLSLRNGTCRISNRERVATPWKAHFMRMWSEYKIRVYFFIDCMYCRLIDTNFFWFRPVKSCHDIYEGRLKTSWTYLITPSRNFMEVWWRSLFRSTSLGKRCTSFNSPPTSRKRAPDRLLQASRG